MAKKKEIRVKCERCGRTYTLGMPHQQFCRGKVPRGAKCVHCGEGDRLRLNQCRCDQIVCECCLEDGTHDH